MIIHTPEVPKSFARHPKVMEALYAIVEDFNFEEQQAIYYHHHTKLSPQTIANVLELTEPHVISALTLYAERLASRIDLFKRTLPHDADDTMQPGDILLAWTA